MRKIRASPRRRSFRFSETRLTRTKNVRVHEKRLRSYCRSLRSGSLRYVFVARLKRAPSPALTNMDTLLAPFAVPRVAPRLRARHCHREVAPHLRRAPHEHALHALHGRGVRAAAAAAVSAAALAARPLFCSRIWLRAPPRSPWPPPRARAPAVRLHARARRFRRSPLERVDERRPVLLRRLRPRPPRPPGRTPPRWWARRR